jgi:hypothetical protein
MPQVEDHVEAVIFPYFRNAELVNRKYRTTAGKHFRLEAGCELTLYGVDDIDPEKPLIWVEGELDKLTVEIAGFRTAISVSNGAPPPGARTIPRHSASWIQTVRGSKRSSGTSSPSIETPRARVLKRNLPAGLGSKNVLV